ncbi:MAG TPA: hypothetical protein VFR42_00065, partial [Candidatus Acidoferrum sp.]|nr:hypothetical protein [Candidatus Acidoferrum sp.]
DLISPVVERAQRSCVDATGIGAQLAEDLRAKHGSKVEEVVFNLENKEKMATLTKTMFEERKCRIPSSPILRRSINAVKRYTSPTGHFRFDAERTEAGHADEFWALALAIAAGASARPALGVAVDSRKDWYTNQQRGIMTRQAQEISGRDREQQQPAVTGGRRSLWASR